MKASQGHDMDSGQKIIALCFCWMAKVGKMHTKMVGI